MASIRKEISVDAPAEHVWRAIRDVGRVQLRLAQNFVVDTRLEGDSRFVTFVNGTVVRERIVEHGPRVRCRPASASATTDSKISLRRSSVHEPRHDAPERGGISRAYLRASAPRAGSLRDSHRPSSRATPKRNCARFTAWVQRHFGF
jgi:hypothetical protein